MVKVVLCGAGFLGRHIAKQIVSNSTVPRQVQISSRHPERIWKTLDSDASISKDRLLPAVSVDITRRSTLASAFHDADVVVSLVGLMHGTPQDFENTQWKGAENVAYLAKDAGAKLIHISAIGADPQSHIPYVRTKGLAEQSILDILPDATIIRPSLIFGPEDDFFNRFARLSQVMPFLPVFGGGKSLFQPVYVGDIARLVELISRRDPQIESEVAGRIIEAGGPKTYTYRDLMSLVLDVTGRRRPIISLPFAVGMVQGAILEKLPTNLFTVTRAQVEQLESDNIVTSKTKMPQNFTSLEEVLSKLTNDQLRTVEEILPTYLR